MDLNEKIIIKIIGYVLLSPALFILVSFFYKSITVAYFIPTMIFTGDVNSTTPLYTGLMAIAGAYLIKDKN